MLNLIRRILLGLMFILMLVSGGLWYWSGIGETAAKAEKQILKAYEDTEANIEKIKKVIKDEGYDCKVSKTMRKTEKKVGYKVIATFDKEELAKGYIPLLEEIKMKPVIKKTGKDEGVYIQVGTNYVDKKKAEAVAKKAKEKSRIEFEVVENFTETTRPTNEIVVANIANKEKAEALKLKLSAITKDIDIMDESSAHESEQDVKKGDNPKQKEPSKAEPKKTR